MLNYIKKYTNMSVLLKLAFLGIVMVSSFGVNGLNAQNFKFTTNPSDALNIPTVQNICIGNNAAELSVNANAGNSTTYQWYKNSINTTYNGSTIIQGQTGKKYTPKETDAGTYYYFATATNNSQETIYSGFS